MSDYKRNPRGARRARKSMSRKALVVLSLMMVLVMAAVGGTVAWLTATTSAVTNTFTVGDINIELTETWNTASVEGGAKDSWTGKMVPGNTLTKDPKVTVKAGSEACWLFVKVNESSNLDTYISYTVNTADGEWTELEDGVFYRKVDAVTSDTPFYILTDNKVTVKNTVLKSDMEALKAADATKPTLTFTAYACQSDNIATAAEAWAVIGNNGAPVTP